MALPSPRLVALLLCAHPALGVAQANSAARVHAVAGCWKTDVGSFMAVTTIGVDSGMTNLPARIKLDTVPGVDWRGPRGSLLRAIPDEHNTRYRDGFYTTAGADSVLLAWTNGFTWLSISAVATAEVMRGVATVGTDYGGEKRAAITLSRIVCP